MLYTLTGPSLGSLMQAQAMPIFAVGSDEKVILTIVRAGDTATHSDGVDQMPCSATGWKYFVGASFGPERDGGKAEGGGAFLKSVASEAPRGQPAGHRSLS